MQADDKKKKEGAEDQIPVAPPVPDPANTGQNTQGVPNPPYVLPPPGNPTYTDPRLAATDQGGGQIRDFQFDDPNLTGTQPPGGSTGFEYDGGGTPPLTGTQPSGNNEFQYDAGTTGTQPPGDPNTPIPGVGVSPTQLETAPLPSAGQGGSGRGQFNDELANYARNWMSAPSRYDADVVRESMDAIRARMDRARRTQGNDLRAQLASSGLIDSTQGAEVYGDFLAHMSEQEQAAYAALLRDQAATYGADRASAFGAGLDVAGFEEGQYRFDIDEALRSRGLDIQKYGIDTQASIARAQMAQNAAQFGQNYALQQRRLELTEQGMSQEEAHRQAQLELQRLNAERGYELDTRRLDQQGSQFDERMRLGLINSLGLDGLTPEQINKIFADMGVDFQYDNSTPSVPPSVPPNYYNPYSSIDPNRFLYDRDYV